MRSMTAIQSLVILAIGSALGYAAATTGIAIGADVGLCARPVRYGRATPRGADRADWSPSDLHRGPLWHSQPRAERSGDRGPGRQEAQHPGHLRRRHRPDECQRLFDGPHGLPHAQHRPDRAGRDDLHRLLRRAELHGGPLVVHHRPVHVPNGAFQGRRAGGAGRPSEGRPDDRRIAQAARLRDRPVRQEPSGRQERVPADGARLRRVLRQSLSPERRGGARAADLPARPRVQAAVWSRAACSSARRPTATTRR